MAVNGARATWPRVLRADNPEFSHAPAFESPELVQKSMDCPANPRSGTHDCTARLVELLLLSPDVRSGMEASRKRACAMKMAFFRDLTLKYRVNGDFAK